MADAEQSNKTTPTPQRRPYHQNRPNNSNRGRGRPDPHVSKALHNFGVTDLREWLNKKHQHEEQCNKGSGPPPDPSYNYLKDPMRENASFDDQTRKHHKEQPERVFESRITGNSPRGFRGRRGGHNRDDRHPEGERTSYIQNPVNIKVELTTATGERSYKLDEETKIANIKHVPDRKQQERRSFRGRVYDSGRGRGQGGRGKGEVERGRGESGRSRGEWVRGRRGRGGRGYGRGRGQGQRYNSNLNRDQGHLLPNIPTVEVPTDENWDNECVDHVPAQIETENTGNRNKGNIENSEEVNPEDYYEEAEGYEEGDEYLEVAEGYEDYSASTDESHRTEEGDSATGVTVEENLVIISSATETQEESAKRTVRFKLDKQQRDTEPETVQEQVKTQEKSETTESAKCEIKKKSAKAEGDTAKSEAQGKVEGTKEKLASGKK